MKKILSALLVLLLVGCNLVPGLDKDKENSNNNNEITDSMGVTEKFIRSFANKLNEVNATLDESNTEKLMTSVISKSESLGSEKIQDVAPAVVGYYIESLKDLSISENERLSILKSISETGVSIIKDTESTFETSRALTLDNDILLNILENMSKAIVKNVPKCGFSKDTYEEATEETVKSMIGFLDEGELPEETISDAAMSITKSAISQLKDTPEFEEIKGDVVKSITKGATEGVGNISLPNYTSEDIAPLVKSVTKGAVEGLGEISSSAESFKEVLPLVTQGSTEALNEIKDELGDNMGEAVKSIAQGSTEAIENLVVVNSEDTNKIDDIIAVITTSVSQESLKNIEGIDVTEVAQSIAGGVAEGVQAVSDDYKDTEKLKEVIIIKDAEGTAIDNTTLEETLEEAKNKGQESIPEETKEIRQVLDETQDVWNITNAEREENLIKLKALVEKYPNGNLQKVYQKLGETIIALMWNNPEDLRVEYADKAISYLEKAAYDYDLMSHTSFWAIYNILELKIFAYRDFDDALILVNFLQENFSHNQTMKLYADFREFSIFEQQLYDTPNVDRPTFYNNYLMQFKDKFIHENYPECDPEEWPLRQIKHDLLSIYRNIPLKDDYLIQINLFIESATDPNDIFGYKYEKANSLLSFFEEEIDWNWENITEDRKTYLSDTLLPLFLDFTTENYPDVDPDQELFRDSQLAVVTIHKMLDNIDDALTILNLLKEKEPENTSVILNISDLYKDLGWRNRESDQTVSLEYFNTALAVLDDFDISIESNNEEVINYYMNKANILVPLGELFIELDDIDSADSKLNSAKEIFLTINKENYPDVDDHWAFNNVARELTHIGWIYSHNGNQYWNDEDKEIRESYFNKALEVVTDLDIDSLESDEDKVRIIEFKAHINWNLQNHDVAINYFKEIIDGNWEIDNRNWIIDAKRSLANLYSDTDHFEEAELLLNELLGSDIDDEEKCRIYRDLGNLQSNLGWQNEESRVSYFEKAIEYYKQGRELAQDDDDKLNLDFVIVDRMESIMYQQYGGDDFTGQKLAYINEKLLPLIETIIPSNYPDVDPDSWEFNDVIQKLINIYREAESFEKALDFLDNYQGDIQYITREKYNIYRRWADELWQNNGELNLAIDKYNLALELIRDFDKSFLTNAELLSITHDEADILKHIGYIYDNLGEHNNAATYFEDALAIYETVTKDNFSNVSSDDYWYIHNSMESICYLLLRLGRFDEANAKMDNIIANSSGSLETGLAYLIVGDIYGDHHLKAEMTQTEWYQQRKTAITYLAIAQDNLVNEEEYKWRYYEAVREQSSTICSILYDSSDMYRNGSITEDELLTYEPNLLNNHDIIINFENGIESDRALLFLTRYYSNLTLAYDVETDEFNKNKDLALGYINSLLNLEKIEEWVGSEAKKELYHLYIRSKDAENANDALYDIVADPNMEVEEKFSVTHNFLSLLNEKLEDLYNNTESTPDELKSIVTNYFIFGTMLLDEFSEYEWHLREANYFMGQLYRYDALLKTRWLVAGGNNSVGISQTDINDSIDEAIKFFTAANNYGEYYSGYISELEDLKK